MNVTQIITLVLSVLTFFGFGFVCQQYWKDKHDKKKNETEKAKENARRERQQEVREVIQQENEYIHNKLDLVDEKLTKLEGGTLDTLRDCILDRYYDCHNKGYRNNYDTENVLHLYKDYQNLNGNSFVEDVIKRFNEIPVQEDFEEILKKNNNKNREVL